MSARQTQQNTALKTDGSFINSVDGYHVRSVFASTLFNIILFERVFFTLLFLSCFFRVSFVVIQEVAHRCRFSSVLRNFCWDKDKSYLIDWCILRRETCIMHKYTCEYTSVSQISFDTISIFQKVSLSISISIYFINAPYDIDKITNFLSISHCYQYQYWYQLIKKGLININSISIIHKSSYQFQYQYQYRYFFLSIFAYQCIVHLWLG